MEEITAIPPPPAAPSSAVVPAPHHLVASMSDHSLLLRFHLGLVWFRAALMLGFKLLTIAAELSNRKDFLLHSRFGF
jgi:hypothetical protein